MQVQADVCSSDDGRDLVMSDAILAFAVPCWECGKLPALACRVRKGMSTYFCHECMLVKWSGDDDEGRDMWIVRRALITE